MLPPPSSASGPAAGPRQARPRALQARAMLARWPCSASPALRRCATELTFCNEFLYDPTGQSEGRMVSSSRQALGSRGPEPMSAKITTKESGQGLSPATSSPKAEVSVSLRIGAIILRALFIGALLVVVARVSTPQNESIWSAYETPGDLIRLHASQRSRGISDLGLPWSYYRSLRVGARHLHAVMHGRG